MSNNPALKTCCHCGKAHIEPGSPEDEARQASICQGIDLYGYEYFEAPEPDPDSFDLDDKEVQENVLEGEADLPF